MFSILPHYIHHSCSWIRFMVIASLLWSGCCEASFKVDSDSYSTSSNRKLFSYNLENLLKLQKYLGPCQFEKHCEWKVHVSNSMLEKPILSDLTEQYVFVTVLTIILGTTVSNGVWEGGASEWRTNSRRGRGGESGCGCGKIWNFRYDRRTFPVSAEDDPGQS